MSNGKLLGASCATLECADVRSGLAIAVTGIVLMYIWFVISNGTILVLPIFLGGANAFFLGRGIFRLARSRLQ